MGTFRKVHGDFTTRVLTGVLLSRQFTLVFLTAKVGYTRPVNRSEDVILQIHLWSVGSRVDHPIRFNFGKRFTECIHILHWLFRGQRLQRYDGITETSQTSIDYGNFAYTHLEMIRVRDDLLEVFQRQYKHMNNQGGAYTSGSYINFVFYKGVKDAMIWYRLEEKWNMLPNHIISFTYT